MFFVTWNFGSDLSEFLKVDGFGTVWAISVKRNDQEMRHVNPKTNNEKLTCCKFGPDDNDLQILNKGPRTEGKTRNSVVQAGSCSPREKQSAPIAKLTLASAESNLKLKESQRLPSIVIRLDYPIDGAGGIIHVFWFL